MRYSKESGKLFISVKEFVNISRRSIGGSLSRDESEPLSESKGNEDYILRTEFSVNGWSFLMEGSPDAVSERGLVIDFTVEGRADRPTRAEISQARAEAFILGRMLCDDKKLDAVELSVRYVSKDKDG